MLIATDFKEPSKVDKVTVRASNLVLAALHLVIPSSNAYIRTVVAALTLAASGIDYLSITLISKLAFYLTISAMALRSSLVFIDSEIAWFYKVNEAEIAVSVISTSFSRCAITQALVSITSSTGIVCLTFLSIMSTSSSRALEASRTSWGVGSYLSLDTL